MPEVITFNCGEFRPGKKIPKKPPRWLPPVLIPKKEPPVGIPPNVPPPVPVPRKPPTGGGPPQPKPPSGPIPQIKWKCQESDPVNICDPRNQYMIRPFIKRECKKCTLTEQLKDNKKAKKDRVCIHNTKAACGLVCVSQPGKCGPITQRRDPQAPTPTPPPVVPPLIDPFGQPIAPLPQPPQGLPPAPVLPPSRGPISVDPSPINGGPTPAAVDPVGINRGPISQDPVDTGPTLPRSIDPVGADDPPTPPIPIDPATIAPKSNIDPVPGELILLDPVSKIIADTKDKTLGPQAKGKPKAPINIDLYTEMEKSLTTGAESNLQTIYSPEYNLRHFSSPQKTAEMVSNNSRLRIFKNVVSHSVAWILESLDSSGIWDEQIAYDLTLEAIAISLQPDLLQAFDTLKYSGGLQIDLNDMLDTIRLLLMTNRIDEFDAKYFIDLAAKHETQDRIRYINNVDSSVRDQAALGIIAEDSHPADPELADIGEKPFLRKSRYFNTDLDVGFPVVDCTGGYVGANFDEEGLRAIRLESDGFSSYTEERAVLDLAEGAGYYASAILCDAVSSVVAVDTSSNIQDAFLVNPEARLNALSIIGEDEGIELSVSSTYLRSEFGDDYDTTSVLTPLYFKLDLSTVGPTPTKNSIVSQTSGTYVLLTDPDEITIHARSNGYSVVAANIDYRDPFLVYANNTSSMTLNMRDITFNNFCPDKGNTKNAILPRTSPFGIILSPGQGSQHNPFGEMSRITSWDTTVGRAISFIPHIDGNEKETWQTPLERDLTIDVDGKYSTGMLEPKDVDNVIFKYETSALTFQDTYYLNGQTSSSPGERARSAIGKMVNGVIDNLLLTRYNLPSNNLTWFDVWRRLSSNEMFEILSTRVPAGFAYWLANKGRGVKINLVLNREPIVNTGLGDVINDSVTDTIYISEGDREWDASLEEFNK